MLYACSNTPHPLRGTEHPVDIVILRCWRLQLPRRGAADLKLSNIRSDVAGRQIAVPPQRSMHLVVVACASAHLAQRSRQPACRLTRTQVVWPKASAATLPCSCAWLPCRQPSGCLQSCLLAAATRCRRSRTPCLVSSSRVTDVAGCDPVSVACLSGCTLAVAGVPCSSPTSNDEVPASLSRGRALCAVPALDRRRAGYATGVEQSNRSFTCCPGRSPAVRTRDCGHQVIPACS